MWKKCPKCQTDFNSDASHKYYCSRECARAAHRDSHARYRKEGTQPKPCASCGELFMPSRKRVQHCSDKCLKASRAKSTKHYLLDIEAQLRRFAYTKTAKFKDAQKRYKKKPEYNYYVKLWKAGLSVKDIKRVEKMPKVSD